MILGWLAAFAFTQLVEAPIYVRGARASWAEALGATALTHPIVWFIIPSAVDAALTGSGLGLGARWLLMVAAAEGFAVLAEALYMTWLGRRRPLLWSLCANAASVTLGLLVRDLTGWI